MVMLGWLQIIAFAIMTLCTLLVGLLILPLLLVLALAIVPFSPLDALLLGPSR
jgi:hypothetical protein